MEKQTAVEWLIQQYELKGNIDLKDKEEALKNERSLLKTFFKGGAFTALDYSTPVKEAIKDGYFEAKEEVYYNRHFGLDFEWNKVLEKYKIK